MAKKGCGKGACKVATDKSIYNTKNAAGKGDQPRPTTQTYQKNYDSIFPNAFKPKWQFEVEERNEKDAKETT